MKSSKAPPTEPVKPPDPWRPIEDGIRPMIETMKHLLGTDSVTWFRGILDNQSPARFLMDCFNVKAMEIIGFATVRYCEFQPWGSAQVLVRRLRLEYHEPDAALTLERHLEAVMASLQDFEVAVNRTKAHLPQRYWDYEQLASKRGTTAEREIMIAWSEFADLGNRDDGYELSQKTREAFYAGLDKLEAAIYFLTDLEGSLGARLAERQATASTSPPPAKSDEPFIPTALQTAILKALEFKALRTDALALEVLPKGADRSRLFKPGGIKELRKRGRVEHHPRIGYYRPDAPPPELPHQTGTK